MVLYICRTANNVLTLHLNVLLFYFWLSLKFLETMSSHYISMSFCFSFGCLEIPRNKKRKFVQFALVYDLLSKGVQV
jgi:hypothetical protein